MGQTVKRITFTALGLSQIKATKKRVYFTEKVDTADRRGLKLCVEPTGTKRFIARVHVPGDVVEGKREYKARDFTLGTLGEIDVAEAHRRLEAVRAAIVAGKNPTPFVVRAAKPVRRKKRRRREVSPLFDRTPDGAIPAPPAGGNVENSMELLAYDFFWEFVVKERKTPDYVKRILSADIVPQWRGRDARTITPREVVLFLRTVAERAPVMANRIAATVSQMFRHGIESGIVDDTPYRLLRKPGGREKATPTSAIGCGVAKVLERIGRSRSKNVLRVGASITDTGSDRGSTRRDRVCPLGRCWSRLVDHSGVGV